jgi:hypothetical protein
MEKNNKKFPSGKKKAGQGCETLTCFFLPEGEFFIVFFHSCLVCLPFKLY